MAAFAIEHGTHGDGEGRYAAGLITLPDGAVRGVEEVARVHVRPDQADAPLDRAGTVVGGLRGMLSANAPASLPLRLAVSTVRAGLGVIEEGLRPAPAGSYVEIAFADGAALTARMPAETAALIRRDMEIARGVLARREAAAAAQAILPARAMLPPAPEGDPPPDEALTSIFRYEKRNGRLRRVAVPAQTPARTQVPEG